MTITRRQALLALGAALVAAPGLLQPRLALGLRYDRRALLAAVRRGDAAAVEKMLSVDSTLARAEDDRGRSAFVLAHLENRQEIAQLLLSHGIESDVVEAVFALDWERMEALAKADPDLMNRLHPVGGTPLYAAALVGVAELWRLRSAGCLPDAAPKGGSGFTPARGAMEARTAVGALTAASELLGNGADVNAPQKGGDTVLHGAVRRRDEVLVRLVIRKGGSVTARDEKGRTPRDLAAALEWRDGVALLDRHAELPRDNRASRFAFDANREPVSLPDLSDVDWRLQSSITASSHGNIDKVKALVGGDERLIFSISSDDELAIEACAHTGHQALMRYHLDHGAPLSLPTAISLGDLEFSTFLLDRDPTLINERGAHDFPVMYYAAIGQGQVDAAELLHSRGAPVDQESQGVTALHWAVRRNRIELTHWLLEHGADPNAMSYDGESEGEKPLQIALRSDRREIIQLLKKAGARAPSPDSPGQPASRRGRPAS